MSNQPSIDDQFLLLVHQIISDNLSNEDFSVEDLADQAGLSRSMLHRRLIKLCGKSAGDLITEVRLTQAKELLEQNAATASEIAYRVGFKNPSYFNTVFKKHFNVSPGAVRKASSNQVVSDDGNLLQVKSSPKVKMHVVISGIVLVICILVLAALLIIRDYNFNERSIAVIPLNNLTGSTDNDYFVDGMHDALVGELSQIGSVRVISRTSTLRYRNTDMLLVDIAEELGVNTIVEGSVIGMDDSLRILIQLIDIFPKERHLLAKEYTANMPNVLTMQSAMARDITKKIRVKLNPEEEELLSRQRTVNPETYKDYLRGMYYLNQGTGETFKKGIQHLNYAIERDPADPFAYAGLALGYSILGHGQFDAEESFNRAMSAAKKAIKIDPTIDEAYIALSILYLYKVCDWSLAHEAFENAIRANPNNEIAHAHFAWYHVLFDDMDKTLHHAEKAMELEPFSASYASWLAILYWYNKQYDEAIRMAQRTLELKPDHPYGNVVLSWVYLEMEEYKLAIEYGEKMPQYGAYWYMLRGYTYVKANKHEKALAYWNELDSLSETQWVNPCYRGMMAAYLGYTDKAFELLNKAVKHKYYPITYINLYPFAESIRDDERYDELLMKMNLPYHRELITSK